MPGYEKIESLKNGGSWGKFWWKTGGFEWVEHLTQNLTIIPNQPRARHDPRAGPGQARDPILSGP